MSVKVESKDKVMTAYLGGEIDHHTAMDIRTEIDMNISSLKPEILVLDFASVTFMDSSGIGLVIGRHNIIKDSGGKIILQNMTVQIKKVMKLSGLDSIATIK